MNAEKSLNKSVKSIRDILFEEGINASNESVREAIKEFVGVWHDGKGTLTFKSLELVTNPEFIELLKKKANKNPNKPGRTPTVAPLVEKFVASIPVRLLETEEAKVSFRILAGYITPAEPKGQNETDIERTARLENRKNQVNEIVERWTRNCEVLSFWKSDCDMNTVEIDGKKYKLAEV